MDGMRGIAICDGAGAVRLMSRNAIDFAKRYPALAADLGGVPAGTVLDGEIVAFDAAGRPSFERLQERIIMSRDVEIAGADRSNPVAFYVFDIMRVAGVDVTTACLGERKSLLRNVIRESEFVKHIHFCQDDGVALFEATSRLGLEGIVAKNASSPYQCGVRSKHWIKVKHTITADVVIAGHRKDYGFLVGRFDEERRLQYVGNVIGGLKSTDYDYLDKSLILRESCPFHEKLRNGAKWFEPLVVAEVKFMHWTSGGFLRIPSFTRLRLDIDPESIIST